MLNFLDWRIAAKDDGEVTKIIFKTLIFTLAYIWGLSLILEWFGINLESNPNPDPIKFSGEFWERVAIGTIAAPIVEEFIFRFLPLGIVLYFTKNNWILLPMVLLTSFIFGYAHNGFQSLPYQGVAGLLLAGVFIKTAKYEASDAGWFASGMVHGLYNLSQYVIFVIFY